jgi:hypothetical protein
MAITLLKISCGKTAGNLNIRNLLSFYIRSLNPWQDHGEYARYPFKDIAGVLTFIDERWFLKLKSVICSFFRQPVIPPSDWLSPPNKFMSINILEMNLKWSLIQIKPMDSGRVK